MLLIIAWRNIWRNKLRSLVVMTSLALGIGAGVFLMSFSWGISEQRVRDVIALKTAHFQVHHADYEVDEGVGLFVPEGESIKSKLEKMPEIEAITSRVVVMGSALSAHNGVGVKVVGVMPEEEKKVFAVHSKITEGDFFETKKKSAILISQRLADDLKLTLNKKLNINFTGPDSSMISSSFKVKGIFQTVDNKFDDLHVYVRASTLQSLMNRPNEFHEIAFTLKDKDAALEVESVEGLGEKLRAEIPGVKLESWRDMDPSTKVITDTFGQSFRIMMAVILLALAFGIVNTMLMSVLERKRELGMLMCVGMNQRKVFLMIMIETLMLVLIGAPLGMLLSALLVGHFGAAGIDLSSFGEGLSSMGFNPMVYTSLQGHYYFEIAIMVVLTAFIAALFPAYKAVKLEPSEAVRAI